MQSNFFWFQSIGEIIIDSFNEVIPPSSFSIFLAENLKITNELTALDVGCGSGFLSIVLAKLGVDKIFSVDISQYAVEATKHNAIKNNVTVGYDGTILPIKGDLFEPFIKYKNSFDIIVSNPPTLAAKKSIPKYYQAGSDGRSFIERLVSESSKFLNSTGYLQFTHPFHADVKKTKRLIEEMNLKYEIVNRREILFHKYHKEHFLHLENLGCLPDENLKFQDKQDVFIFKVYH